MRFLDQVAVRFGIARELLQFFWHNKWWWLVPMITVLLLLMVLMVFAQTSPVGPFIYTLF